jgi:hypothetical protein
MPKTLLARLALMIGAGLVAAAGITLGPNLFAQNAPTPSQQTPSRQLAAARASTTFPVREPTWLPPGAQLAAVSAGGSCATCPRTLEVTLVYTFGNVPRRIELAESVRELVPIRYFIRDNSGQTVPLTSTKSSTAISGAAAAVTVSTGTYSSGGSLTRVDVVWQSGGVWYMVSTTGLDASTAIHVADSV